MEKLESDIGGVPTTFKERLVEELKYHDLSYKVFASKVGISVNTLNMYLYRNSIPLADVAVKMAKVLDTTVEYLITGEMKTKFAENLIQKQEIMNIVDSFTSCELSYFMKITCAFKNAVSEKKDIR